MSVLNKSFWLGCLTGGFLTLALGAIVFVGGSLLFYRQVVKTMDPERVGAILSAPSMPSSPSSIPADYDWSVQTLAGDTFQLSELKGKVVFLNFWATWCPPCIIEMPSIQSLHDQVAGMDIQIVCVSQEKQGTVEKFIRDNEYTFPVYTLDGDPPSMFRTRGIPATFILSPEGTIAYSHVGSARWDDETVIQFMESLQRAGQR